MNFYTSSAPVLVAVPAVIVVLRLYPLVLRGLLRASARSSRAPAFLGLARASRTAALTPALPAIALVLALTVAAFAGMVRDAVINGEVAASWQTAGADATVTSSYTAQSISILPAAARAISAVPGVTHAAEVMDESWTTPAGCQVNVLAVDPSSYAELVARTSGFPQVPAGLLATPGKAGATQPVLASPQAAALLAASGQGNGAVTLSTRQAPLEPVRVRVAGVIASTPALPAGGAFVIMPLDAIKSALTPREPVPVNEMLLTGESIDRARLTGVLRHMLPGGVVAFRSDVLSALTSGPLQHGAFTLFSLAVVVAAILGLAVMLLNLALGAAEREATLARLATMGLGEGQQAWVVALEVLPAVIAAAAAAWACALALPRALAPDLDLSVFTRSSSPRSSRRTRPPSRCRWQAWPCSRPWPWSWRSVGAPPRGVVPSNRRRPMTEPQPPRAVDPRRGWQPTAIWRAGAGKGTDQRSGQSPCWGFAAFLRRFSRMR